MTAGNIGRLLAAVAVLAVLPAAAAGPTAFVGSWWKICTGTTCLAQQIHLDRGGGVIGAVTVTTNAGKPTTVSLRLPVPAMPDFFTVGAKWTWQIDAGPTNTLTQSRFDQKYAYLDIPAEAALVSALRSGKTIRFAAPTYDHKTVQAELTLKDFATVFDGKDFLTLDEWAKL